MKTTPQSRAEIRENHTHKFVALCDDIDELLAENEALRRSVIDSALAAQTATKRAELEAALRADAEKRAGVFGRELGAAVGRRNQATIERDQAVADKEASDRCWEASRAKCADLEKKLETVRADRNRLIDREHQREAALRHVEAERDELRAAHEALRKVGLHCPDDPTLDATEDAHPAWWRGAHAATKNARGALDGRTNNIPDDDIAVACVDIRHAGERAAKEVTARKAHDITLGELKTARADIEHWRGMAETCEAEAKRLKCEVEDRGAVVGQIDAIRVILAGRVQSIDQWRAWPHPDAPLEMKITMEPKR